MAVRVQKTIPFMPASWAFETRDQAGRELADFLAPTYAGTDAVVLAVPRGGVPVGAPIARRLRAPLDVIVPRKIPIPWEPEAGFGAVAPDGTIVLNEELVPLLGLSEAEIRAEARVVQQEIQRRTRVYRGNRPPQETARKVVILTDDGLASGLTMVAAVRSVRRNGPREVVVAVPVAPRSSVQRLSAEADGVVCLIEQERGPFAVASFYRFFPDLSDEEVIRLLDEAQPVLGGEAPA